MDKFIVVEGYKKEPKNLPPRPDYLKKPRTYEQELRSKKLMRDASNCGSPSELARSKWFDKD